MDVAVGGQGNLPVAVREGDGSGVALRGVGEAGEDVPGAATARKTAMLERGYRRRMLAEVLRTTVGGDEVEEDDGDGEDDADEALGEDVEGAGGAKP